MIYWSDKHHRVWAEYGRTIGYGFDHERAGNKNNKGALHRLAHLVPELVDTQEELAFILAELGLEQLHPRMTTSLQAIANELLHEAKVEESEGRKGFERLAQLVVDGEKWIRPVAYDALVLLEEDVHRCLFVRDEQGVPQKVIEPIPEATRWLRIFKIPRPPRPRGRYNPAETPFFDGGIVMMIHMASESTLKPTKGKVTDSKTSCADVVAEVLQKYKFDRRFSGAIKDVWERRSKTYPSKLQLLPPV